ncbi:MAG: hypothetical protein RIG62_19645 [Cyclobacteriaceae bacterium]
MSHENETVGNNGLQQYRREELSQKTAVVRPLMAFSRASAG